MRIVIERGKKRYEAVPCGPKCKWAKPYTSRDGYEDVCIDDCRCPKWWKDNGVDVTVTKWGGHCGLREITEVRK